MNKSIVFQFGERVKELRVKHNMTQEELASRSQISLKYIQRIEGKNPPNVGLESIKKLSDAFGTTASLLLNF